MLQIRSKTSIIDISPNMIISIGERCDDNIQTKVFGKVLEWSKLKEDCEIKIYQLTIGGKDLKTLFNLIQDFEISGFFYDLNVSMFDNKIYGKLFKYNFDDQCDVIISFFSGGIKIQIFEIDPKLLEYITFMFDTIKNTLENIKKDRYLIDLKDSDPKLFSELYDGLLYSVIVQKNRQPQLITEEEYNAPEYIDGVKNPNYIPPISKTKYINVTTGEDAYYSCYNNKLNKELYYISGKHPDGYCLPSCKPIGLKGNNTHN